MTKADVLASIRSSRLIPVIRADSAEQAARAAEALLEAGIRTIEITFTVPGAVGCMAALASRHGDAMVVGAGTVLDAQQCEAAIDAGAQFIVSPSLRPEVIATAQRRGTTVLPGALTPTEVLTAWEAGADFVKIFPCDALGGARYIKALRGPFPHIAFVPTGGVSLETAAAFLEAGAAALGVGGNLVSPADCRAGHWHAIRDRALQLRAAVAACPAGK
ncbi:MAG TPA: bifunctional 4-hydroxy-2-oxoglutarate aldolase/2-dehydro-3-deoxy-phosphogluconate aldolase [Terriglobales bacterium]|jgi:2-dehydro-3-deoxyphosphogluconate aldolase/(4S)-4-hydroxy-2-oxoglutarate aldolase